MILKNIRIFSIRLYFYKIKFMGTIWYIIAIILTITSWYLLLRLLNNKAEKVFYRIEFGVYSFLVWIILLTFLLFIVWWLNIPLSFNTIITITLTTNILLLILNFLFKSKQYFLSIEIEEIRHRSILSKIGGTLLIIRIITKLIFGFLSITNVPTYQDDTFVNRNYRAKVFFERESLVLDDKDKDNLWLWYKQYPLSPYLYKTYLSQRYWNWDEWLVNLPSFIFYLCALLLVFFIIMKETKKLGRALCATWTIVSIPLYYIHGTNPYFDVFQSVYFLSALVILYQYIQKKIPIIYPILFIGILWYTKSEWLLIFITTVLATHLIRNTIEENFKITKNTIKDFFIILWWSILINIPFIIFKLAYGLWFWNGNENISKTTLSFHWEIFPALYKALFQWWAYNLLFFYLLLIILYNIFTKNINKKTLRFLLGWTIAFCIIIFIYLTTFTYQYVLDQTGINRSMMQLIPTIVIILILSTYDIHEKHYK